MAFRAGRYHRIPYHQLGDAQKQLGIQFHTYEEWMTFDKYLELLKMFKHLGSDYWYAHQDTDGDMNGQHLCQFGFVNSKDAIAFKLMIE